MASGIFFQFHASHHAGVNLLGLGTILVLPMARVYLLMLQKQGAPAVFYSKGSCPRIIYNFGTASYQMEIL